MGAQLSLGVSVVAREFFTTVDIVNIVLSSSNQKSMKSMI